MAGKGFVAGGSSDAGAGVGAGPDPEGRDPGGRAAGDDPPGQQWDPRDGPAGIGFLLAQVGAHAAARFAERLEALELTPAQAGILRLLAVEPDLNQRALASRLRAMPSRIVVLVDVLERRGLVARQRRPEDRRSHALRLSPAGRRTLAALREVVTAHEAELAEPLSEDDRRLLTALLRRVADAQGLVPGVHPGYQAAQSTRRLSGGPR